MSKQKVYNFQFEKNAQEGKVTPAMLRDSMDGWIEDYDNVDHMLVAYVYTDPEEETKQRISVAHTNLNSLELWGLVSWIRQTLEQDGEEE